MDVDVDVDVVEAQATIPIRNCVPPPNENQKRSVEREPAPSALPWPPPQRRKPTWRGEPRTPWDVSDLRLSDGTMVLVHEQEDRPTLKEVSLEILPRSIRTFSQKR